MVRCLLVGLLLEVYFAWHIYFSEYSKVITAELIFEGKILEQEVQPIEGSFSIQFSQTPEEIAVEFVNEFFEKDIL